ncbi:MAG: hypothetical protein KA105_07050 [Caulobacter sp.]|nr:hypothetical protein [Caulobacter sp.]
MTGSSKPLLRHPTADAFERDAWIDVIRRDTATQRDRDLAVAAIIFSDQIRSIRDEIIEHTFEDIDERTLLRMSVARANRNLFLVRKNARKASARSAKANPETHIQGLAHLPIGGHALQPELTADDLVSIVVDTLPHWFHQASKARGRDRRQSINFGRAGATADASLSVERSYRDLWQQVLFEPWALTSEQAGLKLMPTDEEDALLWHAWGLRQEAITSAPGILDNLTGFKDDEGTTTGPKSTVIGIRIQGRSAKLKLGPTTNLSPGLQSRRLAIAERSYLGAFLDLPLQDDAPSITPKILLDAWVVLHDIAEHFLNLGYKEGASYQEIRHLSFSVSKKDIHYALTECLNISPKSADSVLAWLTTDPTDIDSCFRLGIWHRPLVRLDDDSVMLVAAPIIFGSVVRRVERWLTTSGVGDRLSKSPPGIMFERNLRASIRTGLAKNSIARNGSAAEHPLKYNRAGDEEIDLLIRIGKTILVGEVKCFLVPAESSERFNYRKKLELAAEQAKRKAEWVKNNRTSLSEALPGADSDDDLSILPIVVVNQATGSGQSIDGCVVTDAHFLKLYLSDGSFASGGAIDLATKKPKFSYVRMYTNSDTAEKNLLQTLSNPPGLTPFINSSYFNTLNIPMRDGRNIILYHPHLDHDKILINKIGNPD